MRTKKRVFRSFGYLECDAFAEYLKEMAASGWHFSFPEFTTSVMIRKSCIFPQKNLSHKSRFRWQNPGWG